MGILRRGSNNNSGDSDNPAILVIGGGPAGLEAARGTSDLGYPVVRLHMGKKCTHSPFVARLTKTNEQGGQYIEERNESMEKAIDEMQPFCGEDQVLKFLRLNDKNPDNLRYRIRYNYDEMTIRSVNKHGYMGYTDSKGRTF